MEIKTSLKQLTNLFARSAATAELPDPVRRFAAQLTVLTAHIQRVEAKADAEIAERKKLDGHLVELADLIMSSRSSTPAPASQPAVASVDGQADADQPMTPEEEAEALEVKMNQETRDEAVAIAAALATKEGDQNPVAAVTPLRKPNGGKKAGGAA